MSDRLKKYSRKHTRAAQTTRSYNKQSRKASHRDAFRSCSRVSSDNKQLQGENWENHQESWETEDKDRFNQQQGIYS